MASRLPLLSSEALSIAAARQTALQRRINHISLIRASDKINRLAWSVFVCVCMCELAPSLRWTPARSRITKAQFDTNPQSFASKPKPFPSSRPFKVSLNGKAAPGFSELASAAEGTKDRISPRGPPLDDDERQRAESCPDLLLAPTM